MQTRAHQDAYIKLEILCLAFLILLVHIYAPASYQPDTNYYFGTALRISQGKFLASIEGLYSPLLSWLMSIPLYFGSSLQTAFRSINYLSILAILLNSARLLKHYQSPTLLSASVLLLIGLQASYAGLVVPTADILAASLALYFYRLAFTENLTSKKTQLTLGLLIGASYYAKAIELIILSCSLVILNFYQIKSCKLALKRSLLCLGITIVTTAPWIWSLSKLYGSPIISAQQILDTKIPRHEYSPQVIDQIRTGRINVSKETQARVAAAYSPKESLGRALYSLRQIYGSSTLFFPSELSLLYFFCLLYFLALTLKTFPQYRPISLCIVVHLSIYLIRWGAHLRYYYPIVPLTHFGVPFALFRLLEAYTKKFRFIPVLMITSFLVLGTQHHLRAIIVDWQNREQELLHFFRELPILRAQKGILTGSADSTLAAQISYELKREYWNSIDANYNESPETLSRRLKDWQITQILWCTKPYENLEKIQNIKRFGPYTFAGKNSENTCFVYQLHFD